MPEAVLFDLDGTLVDTAPDLAAALNRLRAAEGLPALPLEQLRPVASAGTRGMLGAGFGLAPGSARYAELAARFLDDYGDNLCVASTLFPEMAELLDSIEAAGLRWGVMTNKPARYTVPLMARLGLHERATCIVCADQVAAPKPAPDGLLRAAALLGLAAGACIYVGDDLRDIQAARAAGMASIAAAWGYLGCAEPITAWPADAIAASPAALFATARLRERT